MPAIPTITVNPLSPQALIVVCTPSDALRDMTKVTSSVVRLMKPDGTKISLATTGTASRGSLTLVHPFALGDVDQVGTYKARPYHTLADGSTIKGSVQQFQAIDDDGL